MNRPRVAVVVAATDSAAAVARCVASIGRCDELIVAADRSRMPAVELPGVTWIEGEPGAGVPRLRGLGLAASTAEVVAFTEDSCLVVPGWVDAWADAFEDDDLAAATGPVAMAANRGAVDWAVFLCEYGEFHTSKDAGSCVRLAGNNFAVRREFLGGRAVHEWAVAAEVARRGRPLRRVVDALASHVRRYSIAEAIGDRYRFGREYGGLREMRLPRSFRPLAALAAPAIFAIQAARAARLSRGLGGPMLTLPITAALLSAWSAGEALGMAAGRPPAA